MKAKGKKLIIFDCDGVLVDSEMIANGIEAQMLTKLGYSLSAEDSIRKFVGMSTTTVQELIFKESGIQVPENIFDEAHLSILKAFEKELKSLIIDVIENPVCGHFNKCIASSSSRARIQRSLHITQQEHFFSDKTIFTSLQVLRGKPFPDLFIFAAQQMGTPPKDCLVIEDSVAGIKAARSAGMAVLAFLGGSHARFEWYHDQIKALDVPIAFTGREIVSYLEGF